MRGTRVPTQLHVVFGRFIPAYAGNTSVVARINRSASVHPRVCGEHIVGERGPELLDGSSPRMRGTPCRTVSFVNPVRFIPAYAGNTTLNLFIEAGHSVHPRVCGEHREISKLITQQNGSSPRMRGTRSPFASCPPSRRFIPAYAGNTPVASAENLISTVHPRVCGEHNDHHAQRGHDDGSSPRMRGTLYRGGERQS